MRLGDFMDGKEARLTIQEARQRPERSVIRALKDIDRYPGCSLASVGDYTERDELGNITEWAVVLGASSPTPTISLRKWRAVA